jgi:rod shape determining protein RodA
MLVAAVGLLNLYSAFGATGKAAGFERQCWYVLIGVSAYAVMTAIDYRALSRFAWILLGLAVVLILAVSGIGLVAKGARRWLDLGVVRIQPSELAKLAVILALARFAQEQSEQQTFMERAARLSFIGLPVLLVATQPDLGNAVLIALIAIAVGFVVARKLWPLVLGCGVTLALMPLVWELMHTYQRARVSAFLDPGSDPQGAGWHTRQSIFAVGSGRLSGKGFGNATQNQFHFLPEHWTDFPFSVWAEEWGFFGSVLLLGLYFFVLLWVLHVAMRARDTFGAVICVGVGAMLFLHVFVNIAMVLGLAPVVGVTLPLVSFGGSSVVATFLGLGLVSSVSMRCQGY